ncbi:hypothetical protein P775_05705 [Puniceibacterium antarcticum]|uniref:Acyltransferase 3 domain-containing protein n=1 Tax=Puniceibacterium antarcticum TaxID=1206336 RepID=A0A2G8RHV0_9RHOB|nr:acyltransferase [Puniceibacterium antarcticum]PIL21176.1 hypothetical protein P775_05705 [Puniceibacterium antarcticum]
MKPVASRLRSQRSNAIDCIRAYAVMMVLIFHVCAVYGPETLDPVARWFLKYGFLGVDIFFPLSGFLITGFLLKNHDTASIRTFFSRRIFRILPLYFLALAVYVLASLTTGQNIESLHNIWQNILFITGWTIFHNGREMVPYTITWSLSVEEFAYILIGTGAWLLRKRLVVGLLVLAVFSLSLRFYLELQDLPRTYYYPPARLDAIAMGGLLAWTVSCQKKYILGILTGALVVSLVLANLNIVLWRTLLFVHVTLMTCIVIYCIQTYLLSYRNRIIDCAASVGFYSYFIYLFHYFNISILALVARKSGVEIPFWIFVLLALGITYAQAVLSFRYFEGPAILFGRRQETERPQKPIFRPSE